MKLIAVLPLLTLCASRSPGPAYDKRSLSAVQKIVPELEPTSHNKFFGKDYPDDSRTPVMHKFSHPYPTVQDSDAYDKDYVQDENDDGGWWSAQMRYDKSKMDVLKARKGLAEALKKLKKEEADVAKAKAAEEAAEKHSEKMEADEKHHDEQHDNAHDALKKSTAEVDSQVDVVEDEVTDLEACKKQLAAVRKKLEALLAKKAEYVKNEKDRKEDEAKKEADRIAKEKKEEELEKKIPPEEDEHAKALAHWKEEKKDVERVIKEVDAAAEKLRKFRKTDPNVDPNGGTYEVAKSKAWKSSLLSGFTLLLGSLLFA